MYLMNHVKMNSVSAQPIATTVQDPVRRSPRPPFTAMSCVFMGVNSLPFLHQHNMDTHW